ncbi:MAG: hypothetical protein K6F73_04815 [Lachnospiraceae bacterium]|nr:hypothetical protein [Lachnospiraceae bacterium]
MKRLSLIAAAVVASLLTGCGNITFTVQTRDYAEAAAKSAETEESLTVTNNLFSITLPDEAAGLFVAEIYDDSISIYDKEAKEAGFGGFAFDVSAFKDPAEYAGGMDVKVGEFTSSDGALYDIVVTYPSDVQYDYTVYEDGMPESYALLYNGSDDIVKTLTGADGDGEFIWGAGTRGEELYGSVIAKYVKAIKEGWDADRLESEDMSSMYYAMSVDDEGSVLDRAGYAYFDVNFDGVDELLIGEIADGDWKGTIYDIYTMVDREPAHVVSGWDRNRYYALEFGMITNEYSGGADMTGWDVYDIEPNTTNLIPQVFFKYDGYENEEQPYFISYDEGETWENVTEEEFNARYFLDYIRFDFTPFSEEDMSAEYADHEQTVSSEGCDTFTQLVESSLESGQGYTNVKIGDTDVLAVALSTFDGYGDPASTAAELFCYDDDGRICYVGGIECGGTATPLAVKDGMLFAANHHYIGKYTITDGKLVVVEEAWEKYDEDGNATYSYSSDDGGDYSGMDSSEAEAIFNELFDEYTDADILFFDTIE